MLDFSINGTVNDSSVMDAVFANKPKKRIVILYVDLTTVAFTYPDVDTLELVCNEDDIKDKSNIDNACYILEDTNEVMLRGIKYKIGGNNDKL